MAITLISLINILRVMKEFSIPSLVFSSSCTVYGQPDKLPVTEASPVKPANSPYGNTKQISEEIIRDTLAAIPGLKAISLRYFNPIGAHPSALIGELPLGTRMNLVPYITQTAIGLREELRVFGNDYDTPDGQASAIISMWLTWQKPTWWPLNDLLKEKQNSFEVFNLGPERNVGAGNNQCI